MNHRSPKSSIQGAVVQPSFGGAFARTLELPKRETNLVPFGVFGLTRWKRALDVACSAFALALLSPFMLMVAAAIRLTSPGPVFFKQERIGINQRLRDRRRARSPREGVERRKVDRRSASTYGKPFTMYKFRTMVVDAEQGVPKWSSKKDRRITGVGRVLRMTRVDEWPQFLNVLRGDMSLVGPRPERAYFIREAEADIPDFKNRLRVKPGLTGLAQVKMGYTNTVNGLADKLSFDIEYIRRHASPRLGFWTDLKIMFQTITVVVTGKGAC